MNKIFESIQNDKNDIGKYKKKVRLTGEKKKGIVRILNFKILF